MNRIHFAIVALADAKSFVPNAIIDIDDAMTTYHALVEACGWQISEYEALLLETIDAEWNATS